MNSTAVSAVRSTTVYTNSQETHNMRIRQQDPATALVDVHRFLSAGGARYSIRPRRKSRRPAQLTERTGGLKIPRGSGERSEP